jgi:hypothetical protein
MATTKALLNAYFPIWTGRLRNAVTTRTPWQHRAWSSRRRDRAADPRIGLWRAALLVA